MNAKEGVYGIVLASGQSTRMGKPKLLLPWKGRSILEHVLIRMKRVPFTDVKVVVSRQDPHCEKIASKFDYSIVKNIAPEKGLGHSLSLAVQSLPANSEAVVIVLGDQPAIAAEDIKRLWLAFRKLRSHDPICPPAIMQMQYRDGKIGHPTLFSHHFFPELRSLNGDKGGKEIILSNVCSRFLYVSEQPYPNDIDTPSDYHQLLKGEENE